MKKIKNISKKTILIALGVVVGAGVSVLAANFGTNWIGSGESISAKKMKDNFINLDERIKTLEKNTSIEDVDIVLGAVSKNSSKFHNAHHLSPKYSYWAYSNCPKGYKLVACNLNGYYLRGRGSGWTQKLDENINSYADYKLNRCGSRSIVKPAKDSGHNDTIQVATTQAVCIKLKK